MFILGLTGSIGMGKTTASDVFRREHIPVYNADEAVHRVMRLNGEVIDKIEVMFPGCVKNREVDRNLLGSLVFKKRTRLKALEAIIHPLIQQEEKIFIRKHRLMGAKLIILDIPLLFETGKEVACDAVAVVSAPDFVQRHRVLARQGMNGKKLANILLHQMPNQVKCVKADFIIKTGLGRASATRAIKGIIRHTLKS